MFLLLIMVMSLESDIVPFIPIKTPIEICRSGIKDILSCQNGSWTDIPISSSEKQSSQSPATPYQHDPPNRVDADAIVPQDFRSCMD